MFGKNIQHSNVLCNMTFGMYDVSDVSIPSRLGLKSIIHILINWFKHFDGLMCNKIDGLYIYPSASTANSFN